MSTRVKNAAETRGRPFAPGNRGRPRGAKNRATRLVEQLMAEDIEDVAKAVIAAAKSGDVQAARVVLDRVAPIRRGAPVRFQAPMTLDAQGIAALYDTLIAATGQGELTAEEAHAVAGVLEMKRRAVETAELEARLRVLEAQLNAGPGVKP